MKELPIVVSSDNNYAHFVATVIASACEFSKECLRFTVLDGGIDRDNVNKLRELESLYPNCSIDFVTVDLEAEFQGYQSTEYITKAAYSRFLIPRLMPDCDKVLYIDVDLIFKDDVKKIFDFDLGNHVIGAVWEKYGESERRNALSKNAQRRLKLGLSSLHHYFNSGVMLINCVRWNDERIEETLLQAFNKVKERLDCPDQDVLNQVFDCNYAELPQSFNVFNQCALDFEKNHQLRNCIIRHFNDKKKPNLYSPLGFRRTAGRYVGIRDYWNVLRKTPFFEDQAKRHPIYYFFIKLFH